MSVADIVYVSHSFGCRWDIKLSLSVLNACDCCVTRGKIACICESLMRKSDATCSFLTKTAELKCHPRASQVSGSFHSQLRRELRTFGFLQDSTQSILAKSVPQFWRGPEWQYRRTSCRQFAKSRLRDEGKTLDRSNVSCSMKCMQQFSSNMPYRVVKMHCNRRSRSCHGDDGKSSLCDDCLYHLEALALFNQQMSRSFVWQDRRYSRCDMARRKKMEEATVDQMEPLRRCIRLCVYPSLERIKPMILDPRRQAHRRCRRHAMG